MEGIIEANMGVNIHAHRVDISHSSILLPVTRCDATAKGEGLNQPKRPQIACTDCRDGEKGAAGRRPHFLYVSPTKCPPLFQERKCGTVLISRLVSSYVQVFIDLHV